MGTSMRIRNQISRCLLIIVAAVVLFGCDKPVQQQPTKAVTELHDDVEVSYSNVPTNSAWWLRIKFVPRSSSIRGISASALNSNWRRASELRQGLIPENLVNGTEGGFAWNPSFAAEGDFNGDGKADQALIGVYEDKDGKFGNFLLILTRASGGKWEKSFLESFEGYQGPIDLTWSGKDLTLWFCTSCDATMWIEWNNSKAQYETRNPSFD
jgi:hypothetical protein